MGKIHLDLDGVSTPCGIELWEFDGDVTTELKEVTCSTCIRKYNSWKKKLDKEYSKELTEEILKSTRR
jgi:hypothetical protein